MNTNRILTAAQAKAAYDAMCVVNNISARIKIQSIAQHPLFGELSLHESRDGFVIISNIARRIEIYENQAAFAAVYGV